MSVPWRLIERYNIFNAQASNATSTKSINVSDFRNVIVRIWTASSANLTLKALWAVVTIDYPNAPDFSASQSVSNNYDYLQMVDLSDWSVLNWTTWFVVSWTDKFKLYEINTNAIDYLSFVVSWRSAWSITVDVLLTDNK